MINYTVNKTNRKSILGVSFSSTKEMFPKWKNKKLKGFKPGKSSVAGSIILDIKEGDINETLGDLQTNTAVIEYKLGNLMIVLNNIHIVNIGSGSILDDDSDELKITYVATDYSIS